MTARVLDGKFLSGLLKESIRRRVAEALSKHGRAPGLGVILVGSNPASRVYVGNKSRYAAECGFQTFDWNLPDSATQQEVENAVDAANAHPEVDGILLQLPLPKGLDSGPLLNRILPGKDADGLHPYNQGLLAQDKGIIKPCTPQGSLSLIDLASYAKTPTTFDEIPEANLAGKRALVIGRSVLVGKPAGLLLLARDATVTYAHSKSVGLPELTKEADIVIAAVGREEMVKGAWIKPGAIVIDVGMNRTAAGKLCGDVEYGPASLAAGAITPVPGGVGPMTVAMLLQNTLALFSSRRS